MPSYFLKAAKDPTVAKGEQISFRDCAEVFKSGHTTNGVYTLTLPNSTEEVKVRCLSPLTDSRALAGRFRE